MHLNQRGKRGKEIEIEKKFDRLDEDTSLNMRGGLHDGEHGRFVQVTYALQIVYFHFLGSGGLNVRALRRVR